MRRIVVVFHSGYGHTRRKGPDPGRRPRRRDAGRRVAEVAARFKG